MLQSSSKATSNQKTLSELFNLPGLCLLCQTYLHSYVHAAEFDGTAIETSLTAMLKVTLHKKGALPQKVSKLTFPLLENANEYIVHGFNYGVSLSTLQCTLQGRCLRTARMENPFISLSCAASNACRVPGHTHGMLSLARV